MPHDEQTVFEQAGGEAAFKRLVDLFYKKVEADPLLRPLFPEDMEPGKHWQYLFLMQYFGGPADYSALRGHPRLRMRHGPFAIDREAAERWLAHMLASIKETGIPEPARSAMRDYFERAAPFMINTYAVSSQENNDA